MVEVYYYIPTEDVDYVVECGLKLSRWFDREVVIEGELRKCMAALLNPKDDIEKYRSESFTCVKLEVDEKHCFVADGYLYRLGMDNPQIMEMYSATIVPVDGYIFGKFRLPECLVTCTVIAGRISVLNKKQDSPVLFDNSEELYINNIIGINMEENPGFNEALLYCFFNKLAEIDAVKKIEDFGKKVALFIEKKAGKPYIIKIPDFNNLTGIL
ncbi:MAG TPA: hypothetical protein GXX14_02125 [Clostridiaceae bacterium]|nr:hypothetical protein [Clostridiaceae bacterium]